MDYSKKGIESRKRKIKSPSTRLMSKGLVTLFRLFIVFIVFILFIGSYAGLGLAKGLIDSAPDISEINVVPTGYRTSIYDIDGNVIQTLIGAHSNRVYVTIDEIPVSLQQAFIAIEDERFYQHDGIDVRGIFRAFFKGLSKGDFDQGASTITQQLLKNQVFDGGNENNFLDRLERKVQEQYLAIQLENSMDKNQILEYYLNTINLSSGTYGVQTAAKRYFNKDIGDINISEAAVIAAIAQSPVYRNPISYTENNAERRDKILSKMLELGFCNQSEYDEAINDDVYSRILLINEDFDNSSYYSYFVDATIEQVLNDLQTKKGYTQTQASQLLYSGGLSVYTTQNPVIQKICNEVYNDESYFPSMGESFWELTYALSVEKPDGSTMHYHGLDLLEYYKDFDDPDKLYIDEGNSKFSLCFFDKDDMNDKIKEFRDSVVGKNDTLIGEKINMTIQPQSSFVVMDQHNGYVSAMIGGRGKKVGNRTLNRATDTVRLPGSTFKVLSTYLPAIDNLGLTLASVQDDAPYFYPGTTREVRNYDAKSGYAGLSTLRKAIWHSMNVVTVKTLEEVTPQIAYDYLLKLGFTSLVESRVETNGTVVSDINHSIALGGITDGVKNIELTAAFASIGNNGIYNQPMLYQKIIDHNGKVILDNEIQSEQVMKESTAWLLTNAMEDVVKLGTGKNCRLQSRMPIAGKTGSTTSYYDLWFSGFSPYYTATIWSGYDNSRTQTNRSYHQKIWRTIMERVHEELELVNKDFKIPDSIVTAKICTKSGKLAVEGLCDKASGGDTTRYEYFAKGTVPTEKCDIHVKVNYCTKGKALATQNCPLEAVEDRVLLNKTETAKTKDTPYLIPSSECEFHNALEVPGTIDFPNIFDLPITNNPSTIYGDLYQ
ncbi:MAG TPA: penicillin-binding protein [Clostridiales bacterium]|nr:penicillin-binding protein [Clostridiales bacterium]